MRTPIVLLPVPLDNWQEFKAPITRFCDTWLENPPGCECILMAICCKAWPDAEVKSIFKGLPVIFQRYDGDGFDLGAHQFASRLVDPSTFLVCCTSRMYFHKTEWLEQLKLDRDLYGRGLYGVSHSREGGRMHICTRGYCLDARDLAEYPTEIISRDQGVFFECGDGSLTDWMISRGMSPRVVCYDGDHDPRSENRVLGGFRSVDQSNMLIWDKHTDAYKTANAIEKRRLQATAHYGLTDADFHSQFGEDRWMLDNLDLPEKGYYVEVGAFDGVQSSNTYWLEKMGWEGVLVEPIPELAEKCRMNRKAIVRQLACVSTGHFGQRFFRDDSDLGLSGINRNGTEIDVRRATLDEVIVQSKLPRVDVLSIDTEGTELDVWDFRGAILPKYVIIEWNTLGMDSREDQIKHLLESDSYRLLHRTECNLIFQSLTPELQKA